MLGTDGRDVGPTVVVSDQAGSQGTVLPPGRANAALSVPVVLSNEDKLDLNAISPVSATGTITSTASSTSSVVIKAANTARDGLTIFNESTAVLYVACAATASVAAYTTQIAAGGYWELPLKYTGIISGLWATANGNARVTEFS